MCRIGSFFGPNGLNTRDEMYAMNTYNWGIIEKYS